MIKILKRLIRDKYIIIKKRKREKKRLIPAMLLSARKKVG